MLKKFICIFAAVTGLSSFAAVEVNKATQADLDSIKGIGPATSKQILSERKSRDYKDWEDFMGRVKGVGEAKATRLSAEGLTVNGQSYKGIAPPAISTTKAGDMKDGKSPKSGVRHEVQEQAVKR